MKRRKAAAEIGYPVLLKASAGGGGKGMRLVERADDLEDAFERASGEALAAFGDGTLYLEKLITPARHVEVQVLCDADGGVLTLGERECSIQRRHQKLIEESPSPALDDATREAMETGVARACRAISYLNAGTFEFLLAPDGSYYFIELNARLQVEHPVSELVTGIDIVREQLQIAAGEQLHETGRAARRGHAIEIRLNAEDPARGFAPAPGVIERFRPPLGPGVRLDTHIEEGSVIPPYYDSLIGKLIVWDEDRASAIERSLRALERARAPRRSDHERGGARDPRERHVPERALLDELSRRDAACRGRSGMSYVVPQSTGGSITVTPAALHSLVAQAGDSVEGAQVRRGRRRLDVAVAAGHARVRLELTAPLRRGSSRRRARRPGRGHVRACDHVRRGGRRGRRVRRGDHVSGGRRTARRTALFLLYQWDVTGQPLASLYEGEIDVYARETAEAVAANAEEYDRRITEAAEGWTADRLGAIERNILRIALHELDRDDIPDEVAIDEAVNLAKRYATDDAARLVNGILGRIVRERVS